MDRTEPSENTGDRPDSDTAAGADESTAASAAARPRPSPSPRPVVGASPDATTESDTTESDTTELGAEEPEAAPDVAGGSTAAEVRADTGADGSAETDDPGRSVATGAPADAGGATSAQTPAATSAATEPQHAPAAPSPEPRTPEPGTPEPGTQTFRDPAGSPVAAEPSAPDPAAANGSDRTVGALPGGSDAGQENPRAVDEHREAPTHDPIVPVQSTSPSRTTSHAARWGRRVLVTVVTLALMLLIPTFVARLYVIPSGSMETTLHGCNGCDNDRVLVDRLVYRFTEPRPGEIVVFNAGPEVWTNSEVQNPRTGNPIVRALERTGSHVGISPPDGSDFVKRVIAMGGQTVQCCDPRNRILIDGKPVDEPYLYFDPAAGGAVQKPFPKVIVPPGTIFVMGDNRNASLDSRAPGNGPVPVPALAGKVRLIVTPFARFGTLDDTDPRTARR